VDINPLRYNYSFALFNLKPR